MASYHLTAKIGAKGKAAAHAAYISREGKYTGRERYEDLEATAAGNMPKWAEHAPAYFWNAADEHERANGSAYREIEVALPRELNPEERRELVEDFVRRELGDQHVYQWAIHTPKAALEKGEQPHAHIMYSERRLDGIERDPDHFFKRYNAKNPERGGAQKASGGKARGAMKDELLATRRRWAEVQNEHLARHGHEVRVDHRSLKDQGIDRTPEKHLGGAGVRALAPQDITALLRHRAAEGAAERAQYQVLTLIDLSGDLAAAKSERARLQQQAVEASKRAVEASQVVVGTRYAQALESVTIETLATVPGLFPVEVIRQAVKAVESEVQKDAQSIGAVNMDGTRRQVLAQPAYQQRLAQADHLEAQGKATLQDVAGMGFAKKLIYDTKGMTQDANARIAQAKIERDQVLQAVERSPEMEAARAAAVAAVRRQRQIQDAVGELGQLVPRAERGQALFDRPPSSYRIPETVGRVADKARAIAPHGVRGMPAADVEKMTARAIDVAWKAPEGANEHLVKVSRFVVPAEQRVQQLKRGQIKGQERGLG